MNSLKPNLVTVSAIVLCTTCAGCALFSSILTGPPVTVDFSKALELAEKSNAAYMEPSDITSRFSSLAPTVKDVPASEVRFFVTTDDAARTQLIAVRGTSNLANARVDAEFLPEPDEKLGIHLHRGFAVAAREILGELPANLKKDYATTITGHSLGGAIAVILGMYLDADGYRVESIVTFGQPKVTNVAGSIRYHDLPLLRFVNEGDPVADVPPALAAWNWVYTHMGSEVVLGKASGHTSGSSRKALASSVTSFWDDLGTHELPAHKMDQYIRALTREQEAVAAP